MKYRSFLREITRAYEHKGGIKTLCLGALEPEWFSAIQKECSWIIESAGSSDVAERSHVTNWTRPSGRVRQFSLFNTSGDSADTKGDYGHLGDARKKRLVFPQLKALSRFVDLFAPALRNFRLNGMGTSASLNAHEESSITTSPTGSFHVARFHLPIFTNPQARVYLDDETFHYDEGRVYFFHHGCVHAASNAGSEPRYHLVLDTFLDRSLFKRLFPSSPSPDPGFRKVKPEHSRIAGEPFHFPDFAQEDGSIVKGGIQYGRRAPGLLAFYKNQYPSVFGAPKSNP